MNDNATIVINNGDDHGSDNHPRDDDPGEVNAEEGVVLRNS